MTTAAQALEARPTVEEVMRLADAVADAGSQMLPAVEIARRLATLRAALESTAAELEALRKDAARLDYLDARNAAKNAKNGTTYGWRLTENHNRIALEDHNWPAIDVRAAIDAAAEHGRRG